MSAQLYTYVVANNSTPFSITPGGFSNFSFSICISEAPMSDMTSPDTEKRQITWVLRDRFTNEVFHARQDISTDHAALYASLVSERPLLENHVYETLRVSVPEAQQQPVKPAASAQTRAEHRRGVARGTHVMTARGEVRVERLQVGDRIITRDHGMQPIRWIGAQTVTVDPQSAPVVFAQGAIKNGRDLVVSPDHRVVLKGADAMLAYGVKEVLVPARQLVNGTTVVQAVGGEMEYFQILTDQHEVIYTEAAAVESFMPSPSALALLPAPSRAAVYAAFPDLAAAPESYGPCARGFVEAEARS